MWGAIIGDIAGSFYEWFHVRIKTKEFEFFNDKCTYTDDTVCTAAVAEILLDDLPVAPTLQEWCRANPGRDYGGMFADWITQRDPRPYKSFGNGAAMRVSPAAFLNRNRPLKEALEAADLVTEVTHNHPEGIKGARATTHAIWLAFQEYEPKQIRETIEREYGYDLSRTVDEIRPRYSFDITCQGSVPEAITCALESTSYEDAVRNAISLGGDSDTLAAIAGPIAEAMYGTPHDLVAIVTERYLTESMDWEAGTSGIVRVMTRMYEREERNPKKYKDPGEESLKRLRGRMSSVGGIRFKDKDGNFVDPNDPRAIKKKELIDHYRRKWKETMDKYYFNKEMETRETPLEEFE